MFFQLYGLLHLAENERSTINFTTNSFDEQIKIYLRNAINLSESLKSRGVDFVVLTNRKKELNRMLELIGYPGFLKIEEISFKIQVPSGMKFYSAHFKLDVFSYLASVAKNLYVGLIDLDMIAINKIPQCLEYIVRDKIPLCYDISDLLIPAYGHDRIFRDMQRLYPNTSEGRWHGGEFIAGSPDFFSCLYTKVKETFEEYIKYADSFQHQGDEILTSVALEKLRRDGLVIADAGTLGIVGRYWNFPTMHPQRSFEYFKDCFLLHLPADKKFLAELDEKDVKERESFLRVYTIHHKQKQKLFKRQKKLSIFKDFIKRFRTLKKSF